MKNVICQDLMISVQNFKITSFRSTWDFQITAKGNNDEFVSTNLTHEEQHRKIIKNNLFQIQPLQIYGVRTRWLSVGIPMPNQQF